MVKLERLIEKLSAGCNYIPNYETSAQESIGGHNVIPFSGMKTILVEHPCLDISQIIDEKVQNSSLIIPKGANAYIVSDFNPDTQHLRKCPDGTERMFSVYAIRFFYHIRRLPH